ncbi:MAG: diaminopimelate decarboxylase [Candidatus Hadarchaeaceae archaeon]
MLMLKEHFSVNSLGHLVIGRLDAVELAERFGTPLYVVDEQRVRERYRRFLRSFSSLWPEVRIQYALKACSNMALVKILQSEGAGADVSSEAELRIALNVGIPGEMIVFNGNYKTHRELELAILNEVLINVDSIQELETIDKIARRLAKQARIGFRINPDIRADTHPYIAVGLRESKFGFDVLSGQALAAYERARQMDSVEILGIHANVGSQILDVAPFVEEAEKIMGIVSEIKEKFGIDIKFVDFGGGIGIPYKPEDKELPPEDVAEKMVDVVSKAVQDGGLVKPTLLLEPGRFIVGDSCVLLARVGYIKERPGMPDWVAVDAGMNALMRPALYGAYHHIELANKMTQRNEHLVNVAGPLCESGDFLGKNRKLPRVEQGDLVAVFDVGAYGLAMACQHTAQPRPAMVVVNGERAELVRRRETYDDLTRLDRVPSWLK